MKEILHFLPTIQRLSMHDYICSLSFIWMCFHVVVQPDTSKSNVNVKFILVFLFLTMRFF